MKILALASLMTLALSACASTSTIPEGVPVDTRDTSLGEVLTDSKGMTLYIFTRDEPGKSNCYDGCAQNWPPLFASSGASGEGKFTVIDRKDGTQQWAYDGEPLYYWVNDKAPGDVTGHGVGEVWYVIKMEKSGGMSY